MTASTNSPQPRKYDRRAEYVAARNTYILIFGTFLTLCIIAVIATTRMEAAKTGFKPITTTAPMSFIDKTYMKQDAEQGNR